MDHRERPRVVERVSEAGDARLVEVQRIREAAPWKLRSEDRARTREEQVEPLSGDTLSLMEVPDSEGVVQCRGQHPGNEGRRVRQIDVRQQPLDRKRERERI